MSEHTETLGVDGLNPLSAEQPATQTPIGQEAKFRTGIVSLLAGADWHRWPASLPICFTT